MNKRSHIICPSCGEIIDPATTIPYTKKELPWAKTDLSNYAKCPKCNGFISLGQADCVGEILSEPDYYSEEAYNKAIKYMES